MSKFKVGDRVRRTRDRLGSRTQPFIPKGAVGTVIKDDGDSCPMVEFDGYAKVYSDDELMERVQFTKADLKSGYLVEYRSGERRLVVATSDGGFVLLSGECMIYNSSSSYNDELRCSCTALPNDIMKVYGLPKRAENGSVLSTSGRELIWQREEKPAVKKMTVSEVCKALGYDVEIVKDGATDA